MQKQEGQFLTAVALGEADANDNPVVKLSTQLAEAENELATKEKLRNALAEQVAELKQRQASSSSRRDDAVIEALNAAPEVKRLFVRYSAARQAAVDLEAAIRALPFGYDSDFRNGVDGSWAVRRYDARADAGAAWRNACAALKQNAGAELPSE